MKNIKLFKHTYGDFELETEIDFTGLSEDQQNEITQSWKMDCKAFDDVLIRNGHGIH